MGELKFDVGRMKEINSRLDDIKEQLQQSSNEQTEEINTIVSNITGDLVQGVLKNYSSAITEITESTVKQIASMKEYLQGQIIAYSTTEQSGADSLADIQSQLSALQ